MWLSYPIFDRFRGRLIAVSTTRHGGVSNGRYASMNLCNYSGDHPAHVAINRQRFCDRLGIAPDRLIFARQTHADRVATIDAAFLSLPPDRQTEALEGVDALITAERQVCIGILTADCVPILLFDADKQAIAAIHAGWRGTAAGIVAKSIQAMRQAFGTQPGDLYAAIGPCISQQNYEVGDELYTTFESAGFPVDRLFRTDASSRKQHLDLPAANHWLLTSAGVRPDGIAISGICSSAHADRFFSARKLGVQSGRTANCIMLY